MESDLSPLKYAKLAYYWAKFLGLAPVTLKKTRFYPATLPGKLYPIILSVVYLFGLPMAMSEQPGGEKNTTSHLQNLSSLGSLNTLVSYLCLVSIPILLVSIGKNIVPLLNDLCGVIREFRSLGIVEDTGKYFKGIFVTTVRMNSLVSAITIIILILGSGLSPLLTTFWFIKDLSTVGTVLIFSQILIFIRQNFSLLSEKLYDGFGQDPGKSNLPGNEILTDLDRIEKIAALHFKLCELLDRITQLLSGPILLCILQFFGILITFSYQLFSSLVNSGQLKGAEEITLFIKHRIFAQVLVILTISFELLILFHVPVTTCKQGNSAKVKLFEAWHKFQPEELNQQFVIFSLQLLHKPVAVSVFGFFDLDYNYLFKLFGAAFAYLIVVIQSTKS